MTYKIRWEGVPRPDLELALREDLEFVIDGDPDFDMGSIIFHTYWLTEDSEGPSVGCSGCPETGDVIAEYFEKTKMITLGEFKAKTQL